MRISAYTRLTRTQKSTVIGLAAVAGATALTAGAGPAAAASHHEAPRSPAKTVAAHSESASAGQGTKSATVQVAGTAHGHATKVASADKAKAAKSKAESKAASKAKQVRAAKSASRSAPRPHYANNLDGWIKEARSIMHKNGIPGSYHGIKKNVMRESGGDPNVANNWDVNAQKGTPSKGLLQMIQPTFDQYHVKGTKDKITDPVANITAACNYAADKYGSMDNVNSAY